MFNTKNKNIKWNLRIWLILVDFVSKFKLKLRNNYRIYKILALIKC